MNGSSQFRMDAAPCVSMSIKTSMPFFKFAHAPVRAVCRKNLRGPWRAPENRLLRRAPKICLGKKLIILAAQFHRGAVAAWCRTPNKKRSASLRSACTDVVFPAPDGAETTKRIPCRLNRLLKILDLLADLFQFGLAGDDVAARSQRHSLLLRAC